MEELIVIHYCQEMLKGTKIIGGRAQWCKRTVRFLIKDFRSLNLVVHLECSYPLQIIDVYFRSQEDMNFYKLTGNYKNLGMYEHNKLNFIVEEKCRKIRLEHL